MVLDLAKAKAGREARIKATRDRARAEMGVAPAAERGVESDKTEEVKEEAKAKSSRKTTRGRKVEEGTTASKAKQEN